MGSWSWLVACVALLGMSSAAAAATDRIGAIRARGSLHCGIWPYVPGFAIERDGRYAGFDVDICRAVAASILGDANKVRFVTLSNVTQLAESTDVDLAVRRLTWTLSREAASGMVFGPITYYDGQGFLVPRHSGIQSVAQLAGERICVLNMEHHPKTLYDYFRDTGREIQLVLVESDREAEEAMRRNRCRAYSADISWLAAARSVFSEGLTHYEILPDLISKEPLAPLMRAADTELVQVVRWTIFALIEAEELGLNSHNIDLIESSPSRVRAFGPGAGDWVRAIIAGVGNYGEVFDRNLGADSSIKLDRGLNRLWTQGGLMYAPPLDR